MRYAQLREYDVANGEGIRTTLFVTGCHHRCRGCFNKAYADFSYGEDFTEQTIDKIIGYIGNENIRGMSLLGGEPFEPENLKGLTTLTQLAREIYPDKDIWVWSGFKYEDLLKDEPKKKLLLNCDILVDGRFIEELKNLKLAFRGSSNQRIIDIQKSIQQDKVILHMK